MQHGADYKNGWIDAGSVTNSQAPQADGSHILRISKLLVLILALFAAFAVILFVFEQEIQPALKPEQAPIVNAAITAIGLVLALVSVWAIGNAVYHASSGIIGESRARFLRRALTYTLAAGVIIAALSRYADLTGYLYSLGIAAIILGLAAQTLIGNLLAGLIVFAGRPFKVGDYVRIGISGNPVEGRVLDIDFLKCKVETADEVVVSVPNNLLVNNPISNYTIRVRRPLRLTVTLEGGEDEKKFREIISSQLVPALGEGTTTRVYNTGYDADGTYLEVWVSVRTAHYLRERSELLHTFRDICTKSKLRVKKISLIS